MKTLRELTITGGRDEIERFLVRLLAAVGEDWERDIASEARVAGSVSGTMYCFACSEQEERRRAALWLHRDALTHIGVTNVFPILKGSLTRAEYNAIVAESHRRFVKPAAQESAVKATLTEGHMTIEDWLTPRTAELLRRFSRSANRSTGTGHPLDEQRWFEFVWAAHKEGARLSAETLGRWLEEDEGWAEDQAFKVAAEYERARALLAFSAQAA